MYVCIYVSYICAQYNNIMVYYICMYAHMHAFMCVCTYVAICIMHPYVHTYVMYCTVSQGAYFCKAYKGRYVSQGYKLQLFYCCMSNLYLKQKHLGYKNVVWPRKHNDQKD